MFFVCDMIIDQNVRLYFCKYLIDFTSKLCAKNFALIIKESSLNHGCSNAKILRFIFINPNREWNEETCQCSELRTDQWFVSKCVSPENVFCFLSVPTETADIGIIKQPVQTLEELRTSPKASALAMTHSELFFNSSQQWYGVRKNCKQFKPQEICTAFIVCKYLHKFAK